MYCHAPGHVHVQSLPGIASTEAFAMLWYIAHQKITPLRLRRACASLVEAAPSLEVSIMHACAHLTQLCAH